MTVIAIETARSADTSAPTLSLNNGLALHRAITNALLFTVDAKAFLPVLRAVRFERTEDGTLTLVSTDRYRLFNETVEHTLESGKAEFGFLLAFDDAKRLADVLKTAGKFSAIELTVEDTRLKVQAGGVEITLSFEEGEFPKWRKLMPKKDAATQVGGVAIQPAFLLDLGKLKIETKGNPAHFEFYGPGKPIRVSFTDGPLIWQMPVRIPEAQPAKQEEKTAEAA